jgi:O-antigen/teichoic acid export membrane protein
MFFFIKISSINLRVSTFKKSIKNIKTLYRSRLYYGFQEIQTAIYGQSSMIILFYLLTTELYGVYRSLLILVMPISLISYSMTQVFINYLKKDIKNIKIRFRKIFLFSFIVSIFIISIFLLFEEYMFNCIQLNYFYKNIYLILIIGTALKILMTSYIALLVVLDMQKVRFYANLIGALFLLISLFLFVKQDDLFNSVLIYTLSIIIVFLIKFIYSEKELIIK